MKIIIKTLVLLITFTTITNAQEKISISDIQHLDNTYWTGELMYVDYSSGKQTVLQTSLNLSIKSNKVIMSVQYGDEPEANSKSIIKIKKNGKYFGKEKIINVNRDNGIVTVITSFNEKDNDKAATMFKTYVFGTNNLSITKEVLLKGTNKKFIRNKYSYTKL